MNALSSSGLDASRGDIAIAGGGPAALLLAIALARRGMPSTVFERDAHPELMPRFNPDRSYTIDITGHGLRALRHIEAVPFFDERVNRFRGLRVLNRLTEEWREPGWTGSRGDIMRALMAAVESQYRHLVSFEFDCEVDDVDVLDGTLTSTSKAGQITSRRYDLVVGADGAGSVVRAAMTRQVAGFATHTKTLPNYCTVLELDQVGDRLDPQYLHLLSVYPFCVAGAIRGDRGHPAERWFCSVGTRTRKSFASPEDARQFLAHGCPRVLELTSDLQIAAYAQRNCYHIGRSLSCSQLHGGKAVLIGDAAAPFPPIGQGLNAALESAMLLDICIGQSGATPAGLQRAARAYSEQWKPEADAVAWISERHLFENRFHMMRTRITGLFGLSVAGEAKRSDLSYSDVKRQAARFWPLWA